MVATKSADKSRRGRSLWLLPERSGEEVLVFKAEIYEKGVAVFLCVQWPSNARVNHCWSRLDNCGRDKHTQKVTLVIVWLQTMTRTQNVESVKSCDRKINMYTENWSLLCELNKDWSQGRIWWSEVSFEFDRWWWLYRWWCNHSSQPDLIN